MCGNKQDEEKFISIIAYETQGPLYKQHGWTPLIMAAKGGYLDVSELLLEDDINVNAVDQSGCSALSWACKEGHEEIVLRLLNKGSFLNIPDKAGDTPLILASREGYANIANALVTSYADIDTENKQGKTALHVSVERGHVSTTDVLLNAGATIEVYDKAGDTPLHIAVRNHSKAICDLLLRDPKFSYQSLHCENNIGETPYQLDTFNKIPMLTNLLEVQDNLPENEFDKMDQACQEEILVTTMADFLVESLITIPMTIGIYSRWGSGKSTYSERLMEHLEEFREQEPVPVFVISWGIVTATILIGVTIGLLVWITSSWGDAMIASVLIVFLIIGLFAFARLSLVSRNERLHNMGLMLTRTFTRMLLLLKVMYCIPPSIDDIKPMLPVHLINVDLSHSIMINDNPIVSIVNFIDQLNDHVEKDIGMVIPRLYRLFQTTPYHTRENRNINFKLRWKKSFCCVPSFVITFFVCLCLWISLILFGIYDITGSNSVMAIQVACCCILTVGFLVYLLRLCVMVYCYALPMKKRVKLVSTQAGIQEDTFLNVIKQELELCADMIECIDGFARRQTRVVINLDLIDSLEQEKVLTLIHSLSILLTEPGRPYLLIFSVDPRLLVKAVEQTLSTLPGPAITPYDYLKNLIDLPFYIQETVACKIDVTLPEAFEHMLEESQFSDNEEDIDNELEWDNMTHDTNESNHSSNFINGGEPVVSNGIRKGMLSNNIHLKKPPEDFADFDNDTEENIVEDISHLIRNNENGSLNDVKRIMNIVSLKGRVLKQCDITFQWSRIAAWVSLCDGWPYKATWLIILCSDKNLNLPGKMSLRRLYNILGYEMPVLNDVECNVSDGGKNYFDTFLASYKPMLTVSDVRVFSSVLFYIDPTIRKLMVDCLNSIRCDSPSKQASLNQAAISRENYTLSPASSKFLWRSVNECPMLAQFNVEDVFNQLSTIEGLDESLLETYKTRLLENNINGRVLLTCDMQELRETLKMSFGDWQLFKTWILSARNSKNRFYKRNSEKALSYTSSRNNTFVDDSRSVSTTESPKLSICGSNPSQKSSHKTGGTHKKCRNNVPSNETYTPSNSCRKKFLQNNNFHISSQNKINTKETTNSSSRVHRSADSGFASSDVDPNIKCMRRQKSSATDPDDCLETIMSSYEINGDLINNQLPTHNEKENTENIKKTFFCNDTWNNKAHIKSDSFSLSSSQELIGNNNNDSSKKKKTYVKRHSKVDSKHDIDKISLINTLPNSKRSSKNNLPMQLSSPTLLPSNDDLEVSTHWPMNPPAGFDDGYDEDNILPLPPMSEKDKLELLSDYESPPNNENAIRNNRLLLSAKQKSLVNQQSTDIDDEYENVNEESPLAK